MQIFFSLFPVPRSYAIPSARASWRSICRSALVYEEYKVSAGFHILPLSSEFGSSASALPEHPRRYLRFNRQTTPNRQAANLADRAFQRPDFCLFMPQHGPHRPVTRGVLRKFFHTAETVLVAAPYQNNVRPLGRVRLTLYRLEWSDSLKLGKTNPLHDLFRL